MPFALGNAQSSRFSGSKTASAISRQRYASEIAKLTEEAEIAQADYEALLNTYDHSSDLEKIRLVSRLTSALMRRDETLFALARALRAYRDRDIADDKPTAKCRICAQAVSQPHPHIYVEQWGRIELVEQQRRFWSVGK